MTAARIVVVALTEAQAAALETLPELLTILRELTPGMERPLSAVAAARLVRRRTQTILEAARSGQLRGKFIAGSHGGKGEWEILPSDARKWADGARR